MSSPTTVITGEHPRLLFLDVFRGMTVASMVLVNNPGSWAHIYWPLEHAEWNGWTPTDLIFTFFLFISGLLSLLLVGHCLLDWKPFFAARQERTIVAVTG